MMIEYPFRIGTAKGVEVCDEDGNEHLVDIRVEDTGLCRTWVIWLAGTTDLLDADLTDVEYATIADECLIWEDRSIHMEEE